MAKLVHPDGFEEAKERIRETFRKVELSPSCYDTAWVAMVPSRHSPKQPCFPQCLDWILENQREDGSWGLNPSHPLLVSFGIGFIETCYGWAVDNKDQISPLGFEIIFGSMIKYAEKLNLNLPLHSDFINLAICKRDSTIERLWQQKDEEIFSNVANCAMAFRLLRMSNYEVFSEEKTEFADEEHLFASRSGKFTSDVGILELHKASQLAIHEKDHILDKINNWTAIFMHQKLLNNDFLDMNSNKEVELALMKFYTTYDRVENRRWYEDCRLDRLGLSEQYIYTTYLIGVAVVFEPEFSDARLMYAKYVMLLTVIDDLFDGFASKDELLNIIELVERWDDYASVGYNSERVKVFFSVFHKTIEELAAIAEIKQGRSVKDHLTNLWIEVMKCMLIERLEWWTSKTRPSIEEYLHVTCVTFGSRLIPLTTQYYLGIKLSKDLLESDEICGLCNCTGIVMRLLNDLQTYKREQGESSMNLVSILMTQSIYEEEAIRQIKEILESNRRKLLKMVLVQRKGSQLPQLCKDIFWRTSKMVYFTYSHGDEYRFPEEVKNHIDQVIYKPLNH
ncbi:synthase [Datura stramonium]|uniref:Synthase n=1 Tax=Datura stramonium TaxID=4076 RepID=A0ABS8UKT6_DATST|nr:synthase [Datura stramonium]